MKQTKTMSKNDSSKTNVFAKNEEVASAPITETKTEVVKLIAKQDTQLADGTFIGEGKEVEVDKNYAMRLLAEKDTHFVLNNLSIL